MRKKMISAAAAGAVLLASILLVQDKPVVSAASRMAKSDMPIRVLYNARMIQFDVQPKMVDGTVLVPIRFVAEKLQGTVDLDGQRITVTKGSKKLVLTIGSKIAEVNGAAVTLTQPAIVENKRTLVPLRAISEGLGVPVEWDSITQFVWIGNKEIPELADIVKPVDIAPYAPLYKGKEFMMENAMGHDYTQATIVDKYDFPFSISGKIFYRMDLAYMSNGSQFIKATTTDKGIYAIPVYYLSKTSMPRPRPAIASYNESFGKDIRIHYYSIISPDDLDFVKDTNYKSFKLNSVDFIVLKAKSDSAILIKNLWK